MIKQLHSMGIKSSHMYTCAIASIGLSIASWAVSRTSENAGLDRADRWGIFVGEWAPTLFALGVALRMEEMREEEMRGEVEVEPRAETGVFDKSSGGRTPTHAQF
ncbi:hypothetical protein [Nonomuraea africana]|uniref:DUF2637 domain-containing protein n=1 Tax=Nonomuraea africana TaxID=46171 RepID=A0ABR9KEF7_9ACTN|nr:hypothetical protein [Nonomuraea africana]MBE1560350.1 hypothetical protein [Nonomuraea africana]